MIAASHISRELYLPKVEIAKIVAEANNERWSHKLGENHVSEEYQEKVAEFFHKKK